MDWRIKGVAQKFIAGVPGGVRINDLLQRTVGNLRDFESNVDMKVKDDWAIHVANLAEVGVAPHDLDYVEIGTGWYPTLPVCFALAGAKSCVSFDLVRHLKAGLTFRMLRRLKKHLPLIAQVVGKCEAEVERSYAELVECSTLSDLLVRARIRYVAPKDAACTGLPNGSVDVVYSNSVFEHVPPEAIQKIMLESHRILRPGGLAVHSANCGDHYAYFDKRITAINYLQYDERDWAKWNNSLLYQNRLRPRDFVEMAEQAGFKTIMEKFKPNEALLSALSDMALAPQFAAYDPEQLASTTIDFIAMRP